MDTLVGSGSVMKPPPVVERVTSVMVPVESTEKVPVASEEPPVTFVSGARFRGSGFGFRIECVGFSVRM